MGESLVFSWLKHEKHCQVVQMNWKASQEWDTFDADKNLDKIYQAAKKYFKQEEDFYFVSKNVKNSDQLIKQGEVDTIGIELDIEIPGKIKNIHAVDVAFHEAGLNYGNEEETKARIIKKYVRTALSMYKYFGVKEADIYFVTPNTREKYRKTYAEAKDSVKIFFDENGFNFSFHFYSNEDFYSSIFSPIERLAASKVGTDTSELFARSLTLVKLMESESNKEPGIIIKSEGDSTASNHYLEERKIGTIVRDGFDCLAKNDLLSKEIVNNLQQTEYSKDKFNSPYPVLIDDEDKRFDDKGRARYYATPYLIDGKEYFLCNHWIATQKENFIKWYNNVCK